jgi:competence transcription factor ComK
MSTMVSDDGIGSSHSKPTALLLGGKVGFEYSGSAFRTVPPTIVNPNFSSLFTPKSSQKKPPKYWEFPMHIAEDC